MFTLDKMEIGTTIPGQKGLHGYIFEGVAGYVYTRPDTLINLKFFKKAQKMKLLKGKKALQKGQKKLKVAEAALKKLQAAQKMEEVKFQTSIALDKAKIAAEQNANATAEAAIHDLKAAETAIANAKKDLEAAKKDSNAAVNNEINATINVAKYKVMTSKMDVEIGNAKKFSASANGRISPAESEVQDAKKRQIHR